MIPAVARRPSVLIVDDTHDIRQLVRLALDREGTFEVIGEAGDGRAAVALAEQLQPDAVLLDLAMPVMDGLEALPLLRKVSPASRVVVLSGFNASQLAGEAMALGAHGYIEKGSRPSQLIAKLKELCGGPDSGGPGAVGPRPSPVVDATGRPARRTGETGGPRGDGHDRMADLFHELATPMAAVIGFTGLLDEYWDAMPPEMQHAVAGIGRSARHMRTVLSNFADADNIDLDALDLALEDTDVTHLVAETVADLAGATSSTPVRLLLPGPVLARIDQSRVRQVVTNLVSSASRFAGPDANVAVVVHADEHEVHISVIDNGPGISPALHPELFTMFSREGATVPGPGLGLYVARRIARAHGGGITVHSDEGRGARFVVRLPRTPAPPGTNAA